MPVVPCAGFKYYVEHRAVKRAVIGNQNPEPGCADEMVVCDLFPFREDCMSRKTFDFSIRYLLNNSGIRGCLRFSTLFEGLPRHGDPLLESGPFKFLYHGFEKHRDIKVLGTFLPAFPALHAQGCKLGSPESDCPAQPCGV